MNTSTFLPTQIAKRIKEVFFGNNWTAVNLNDTLKDISWEEATTKIYNCNTIAILVFHIGYYVNGVLKVLEGGSLDIKDKFSFDCPEIKKESDWKALVNRVLNDAEVFVAKVEKLEAATIEATFEDDKYGNYYRNLNGIVEHSHYHLGQIALLKKIIKAKK
jgi:uncharacterized damage-inducible protein DinB